MKSPPLPFVRGGYRALLADPPWRFSDTGGRHATPYGTMTVAEICDLPIGALMADDAIAIVWVTSSHCDLVPVSGSQIDGMSGGIRVLQSWGFEFKTTGVWVKLSQAGAASIGFGHYLRHAHEIFLIGRRGKFSIEPEYRVPSVFFAPKTTHSTKPTLLHEWIESFVSGPKLELFARSRRSGWAAFGDQIEGKEAADAPETGAVTATKDGRSAVAGSAKKTSMKKRRRSASLPDGETERRRS
jgi:N6-adenosine-specific RNA methylase IME4